MNNALISVVIPAYNAERYLEEALQSILKQAYSPLEIIVVNDGSTDTTAAILASYGEKVKVLTQENKGPAAARNAGIKEAHGPVIAFLDADDLWTDNHLASMIEYVAPGSPYDFVRGKSKYVRNLGTSEEEILDPIFMNPLVSACLFRREVFEKVGLFDESMRQGEDFDWSLRLAESDCRGKHIDDATLLYRRHEHNLTNARDVVKNGQFEAFRKRRARLMARQRTL